MGEVWEKGWHVGELGERVEKMSENERDAKRLTVRVSFDMWPTI